MVELTREEHEILCTLFWKWRKTLNAQHALEDKYTTEEIHRMIEKKYTDNE